MMGFRPAFISHAHADNELCDTYIELMLSHQLDIWYDRLDMQLGPLLPEAIQRELINRAAFILMMTEASLRSFWVRLELATFLGLMAKDSAERYLIPVKVGACDVPPILEAFPWIDALAEGPQKTVSDICAALTLGPRGGRSANSANVEDTGSQKLRMVVREATQIVRVPTAPIAPSPASARATFLPDSLARLGFQPHVASDGTHALIPPVCDVLPGPFEMGMAKEADPQAYGDEQPICKVSLNGFRIARFPITVAEYDCAVRANRLPKPNRWEEQLEQLAQPVVYVSWDAALEYANWLTEITGDNWRLPTEAEWEKAASWDDLTQTARRYPWGNDWLSENANTQERHRRAVSSVGAFLRGASPCGALDMCGNVSEWTHSLYKSYPYSAFDGRENERSAGDRVIRGGSWFDPNRDARTTFRIGKPPVEQLSTRGFRLALSGLGEFEE